VSEADDQLVDDPVLPDGARQWRDLNIVRPMADEMIAIEALDLRPTGAAVSVGTWVR
jgi:hypothetical protein